MSVGRVDYKLNNSVQGVGRTLYIILYNITLCFIFNYYRNVRDCNDVRTTTIPFAAQPFFGTFLADFTETIIVSHCFLYIFLTKRPRKPTASPSANDSAHYDFGRRGVSAPQSLLLVLTGRTYILTEVGVLRQEDAQG